MNDLVFNLFFCFEAIKKKNLFTGGQPLDPPNQ